MRVISNVSRMVPISAEGFKPFPVLQQRTNLSPFTSRTHKRAFEGSQFRTFAPIPVCAVAADQATAGQGATSTTKPQVVLTREAGKNGKLKKMLESRGIHCLEMPLIETAKGPDTDRLPEALQHADQYDWVCITSPEAASVFIKGWIQAGRPAVRIAVVGEGTGKIFITSGEKGLSPQFTPTVANAEHFGPELPFIPGGKNRVLYPSSNKASTLLQEGLLKRGFDVQRLNTYDTLPVTALNEKEIAAAREASVVAVASPSAVRAWVQFVGEETAQRVAVACIGSTSARAADKLGLKNVYYPDEPGMDTFASTIEEALDKAGSA